MKEYSNFFFMFIVLGKRGLIGLVSGDTMNTRIGIIGGGIGGASTAYFARELFQSKLSIDLYESGIIGGRLATSSYFKREYETGGSVIHPKNLYMKSFAKKFGLQKNNHCKSNLGIFDGKQYAFTESNWQFINYLKILYRYGLDMYYIEKQTEKIILDFSKIYDLQSNGVSFKNVSSLLKSMNPEFPSLLKKPFKSYLKEKGYRDKFIDEMVTCIMLTNYGQIPADIHSFVGFVSVSGAGSDLWSVEGGNKKVPEELVKESKANLIQRVVKSISMTDDHKFKVVSYEDRSRFVHVGSSDDYIPEGEPLEEIYDAVAIATPLTLDKSVIEVLNGTLVFPGSFQRTVSTLVKGRLKTSTFHKGIHDILSFNPELFYRSIGKLSPVDARLDKDCPLTDLGIYKVFSAAPLTEEQLGELFDSWSTVEIDDWLAYPDYDGGELLDSFQLVEGLYYNNAIEKAASAMEMSAIAAKNVALLMHEYLVKDKKNEPAETTAKSEL